MSSIQKCQSCGASVYPEHVDEGRAGRWAGQLLCPVCYAEKRGVSAAAPAAAPAAEPAAPAPAAPPPLPTRRDDASEEEPISLVEETGGAAKIQTFGQVKVRQERKQFKRKPAVTGQGACRVRTFHSKIQAESIEFMDNAINEWLDDNPDIEVKFVTTSIGTMAGKFPEPNIILNVWY